VPQRECAGYAGKKQEVKVHYDEGVASHIDPESCAVTREGLGEALTGERIGQPSSRDRGIISGADVVLFAEGETEGRDKLRVLRRPGVVVDPGMCVRFLCGTREISRSTNNPSEWRVCSGPRREGEEP